MSYLSNFFRSPRLPRFSLRTALVSFLVLGTTLGLAARLRQETIERCEAQKWLASRSGLRSGKHRDIVFVRYATETNPSKFVSLMRRWIHPEYNRRIESISISRDGLSEEGAAKIARVYSAQTILLYGPATENSLVKVLTTVGLENLYLDSVVRSGGPEANWELALQNSELKRLYIYPECYLSDSTAKQLAALPMLESLTVHRRHLPSVSILATASNLREFNYYGDRDVRHVPPLPDNIDTQWNAEFRQVLDELAKRESLKRLRLFACDFRIPATLRNFSRNSDLRILHIEKSNISSECLSEIARLAKLETLHLDETPITAEHFQILSMMRNLYGIHGIDPRRKKEIDCLEASLLHCKVNPP